MIFRRALIFTFCLAVLLSGCITGQGRPDRPIVDTDTSVVEDAVKKAVDDSKSIPGPNSRVTREDQEKIDRLRYSADLCQQNLNKMSAESAKRGVDLNACRSERDACMTSLKALKEEHRFDWLSDLAAAPRQMFWGSLLTIILQIVIYVTWKVGAFAVKLKQ